MARGASQAKLDTRLLVDEFARIKKEKRQLEKRYEQLRNQIIALGQTTCLGTDCSAVLIERVRTSLDTTLIKAQFGQKWYDDRCKSSVYYEIQIVER